MKKMLFLTLLSVLSFATQALAQEKAMASPAATAEGEINGVKVTVTYHQPAVKGRKIWGNLVPYGKVWRTGANEATTITFDKDVKIQGNALKAGTYGLFTIPTEKEWTVIFNSDSKQWGAYDYDAKKDVLRINVKTEKSKEMFERLTFAIKSMEQAIDFHWENLEFDIYLEQ